MTIEGPHTAVGNSGEHRDVGGNDPRSGRARIAAKARANSKECFNSLLHHVTPELIKECLDRIPAKSAPGVDGMTAEQARANLDWLLPEVLKQVHQGRYAAPPVRRVYIPKAGGKQRPIGVPQIVDRAVQAAAAVAFSVSTYFGPCDVTVRDES